MRLHRYKTGLPHSFLGLAYLRGLAAQSGTRPGPPEKGPWPVPGPVQFCESVSIHTRSPSSEPVLGSVGRAPGNCEGGPLPPRFSFGTIAGSYVTTHSDAEYCCSRACIECRAPAKGGARVYDLGPVLSTIGSSTARDVASTGGGQLVNQIGQADPGLCLCLGSLTLSRWTGQCTQYTPQLRDPMGRAVQSLHNAQELEVAAGETVGHHNYGNGVRHSGRNCRSE